MLYDADRVREMAGCASETDIYENHLALFMDPRDPAVAEQAARDGIPRQFIDAARRSPILKLVRDWKLALPLHPEFRTLPMVWYVPPLSPLVKSGITNAESLDNMRIPSSTWQIFWRLAMKNLSGAPLKGCWPCGHS